MKTVAKGAIRDEKGNVLILVLILLVVGGLVLTPLLGLMSTGLLAGQVYERHTHRLYAADAGIEDAIWKISHDAIPPGAWIVSADRPGWQVYDYPGLLTVGGKSVDVVVYRKDWDPTCGENVTYQIFSTAATDDGGGTAAIGGTTAIDAYLVVSYMDLSSLLDYAIVSNSSIDIQPNNYVEGDVWLPDDANLDRREAINGTVYDSSSVSLTWPDAGALSTYYLRYVEDAPDPGTSYDINGQARTEGPWYRHGDLDVDNTGDPATLTLEGSVYVRGDLRFKESGTSHNYTIDLNGHTIFAEGTIEFPSHVVGIRGSGCIIAVGNVVFQPSISSNPDDFVLVMSIQGQTTFKPNGTLTGCVAGKDMVRLLPAQGEDVTVRWIDPEGHDLDFPMGMDFDNLPPVTGLRIESWEIE